MNEKLLSYLSKPKIYTQSTEKFWDDEHISQGMLAAHLDPEWDAASRKHEFMDHSVEWIVNIAPPEKYPKLLDLGCGPGLYAERFYQKGYKVTGIDYSRRSLAYARKSATEKNHEINYLYQNYLEFYSKEEFDIITLIYCDFCVIPDDDRKELLKNIYQALKPGGKFIVDVTTPKEYENREETKSWYYSDTDFWSEGPHLCLQAFYRYEEWNTILKQTIIVTDSSIHNYYLWDHTFTKEDLGYELSESGFDKIEYYGDVAGAQYRPEGKVFCAVAVK